MIFQNVLKAADETEVENRCQHVAQTDNVCRSNNSYLTYVNVHPNKSLQPQNSKRVRITNLHQETQCNLLRVHILPRCSGWHSH